MCGIAGILGGHHDHDRRSRLLASMGGVMVERGPDDAGIWMDRDVDFGLAHQRLAILDLSQEGHQPMVSKSGRYVIAYNGEIYNYRLVQEQLGRRRTTVWRGHSDTEVVLQAIEEWGVLRAVDSFIGMFAFAVWDTQEKCLYLVRDRLGIKPLYYGWAGSSFLFASTPGAFKRYPDFKADISRTGLVLLMRYCYIPAPHSIYEGIRKLVPGTMLTLKFGPGARPEHESVTTYWSARDKARQGAQNMITDADTATQQLRSLLADAVDLHTISDVSIGAFLSGGIDSSLITAAMQQRVTQPVNTFTIAFDDKTHDESVVARTVAGLLGTNHTELRATARMALDVVPDLPRIYDEPFADSSQIPTVLVSRLARKHVKVSLTGDGGDESFGGYHVYDSVPKRWRRLSRMPKLIRRTISSGLMALGPSAMNRLARLASLVSFESLSPDTCVTKIHSLAEILACGSEMDLYRWWVSHWRTPRHLIPDADELTAFGHGETEDVQELPLVQRLMLRDIQAYLPEDILTKVDRASMSVGLETRVPLLDHRVVEFAMRLPPSMRTAGACKKDILRRALGHHLPMDIITRPKHGFSVPLAAWLRSELRDWAESLLAEQRLTQEGYFCADIVRKRWAEHLSGSHNWSFHLWDILMFQAWLDEERSRVDAGERLQ